MNPNELVETLYAQSPEFVEMIEWLVNEREYYTSKFDMGEVDDEHIKQGTGDDSWVVQRCIENYLQRTRTFDLNTLQGRQAYMKIIGALFGMGEAMIRVYGPLPKGGFESGEIHQ